MTAELIGPKPPKPPQPKTPRHPTPWIVNPDDDVALLDANGNFAGDFATAELAEAVKDIVNASAGEAQPERKLAYLIDSSEDKWFELTPNHWTYGVDVDAARRRRADGHFYSEWPRHRLENDHGPVAEVYE